MIASFDLELASGTVRAHRYGPERAPLTLCVHGLSANSRSFDFLASELATKDRAIVAIDLRGRGMSPPTGIGTYGWSNHARDVLDAATRLGAERFDLVGHSMGAYVALEVVKLAAQRVRRLVLIDAIGLPDPLSLVPVMAAVRRLDAVFASADAYVEAVKSLGTVTPWNETWESHYRYDLVASGGGVRARTDRGAVLEDVAYASMQQPWRLWPTVPRDTLLVRSATPLGGGFIVRACDRDAFLCAAPHARCVEIDANHYGVMTDAGTLQALKGFLS